MAKQESELAAAAGLKSVIQFMLFLSLLTISISSYIRLAHSGLGCQDWPNCFGYSIADERSQGITVLTNKGEQSPLRGPRIAHRVVASLLGILVLGIICFCHHPSYAEALGKRLPYSILGVTLLLAIIGNIHPSQPIPLLTVTNLLGGMTLLTLIWVLYQKVVRNKERYNVFQSISVSQGISLIRLGLPIIIIQIFLGAWTSANYAGISCTDLMSCAATSLKFDAITASYSLTRVLPLEESGKVILDNYASTIQVLHHLGAVVTTVFFIFLCLYLIRKQRHLKSSCLVMLSLIVLQTLLGFISVTLQLPLAMIVGHNFLAALLLLAITHLNLQVKTDVIKANVIKTTNSAQKLNNRLRTNGSY